MNFQKVKISSFLKERENRIKPAEANNMSLKRLNKIDFSGEIHLSDKKTNTDMILVKKGDLVISGINVEKGAVAVYQGKEDILATIHYSAYIFDETRIDIEYFKVFLKSKAFKEIINSQIRGGIKTEIKPKTFLKLEIHLPDLQTQIEIKTLLNTKMREIDNYSGIQENNLKLLTKLRQQILQDAVQSKLVKQDPKDEPASELLKKIKAEKEKLIKEGKIRKEKPLAPISEDEIPYELPKGWEWVRLGDICEILTQGPNPKYDGIENNNFRVLKTKDFYDNIIHYEKTDRISKDIFKEFERFKLITGDLVFGLVGVGSTSKCTIFTEQKDKEFILTRATGLIRLANKKLVLPEFTKMFLNSPIGKYSSEKLIDGSTGQIVIKTSLLKEIKFPLPPLTEQKRIVEKVDKLMAYCDELKKQVKENQENSEKLMSAVLKESFE